MAVAQLLAERQRYRIGLCAVDGLLSTGAIVAAELLVIGLSGLVGQPRENHLLYALLIPAWLVSLYLHGEYEFHPRWSAIGNVYRTARAAVAGALVCIAITYFINRGSWLSRSVLVHATVFAALGFAVARALAVRLYPERLMRERCLLLGSLSADAELARALNDGHLPSRVEVIGRLTGGPDGPSEGVEDFPPLLGGFEQIGQVIEEHDVLNVWVCPGLPRTPELARAAAHAESLGAFVQPIEAAYEEFTGRAPVLLAGTDWGDALSSVNQDTYMRRYKRLVDIIVTLVVLPAAVLAMGGAAVAIKLLCKGPVLYSQERIGRYGRPFLFTKLRTMIVDAERTTGAVWATENDPRVTSVGRVLRKLRLDELPQLFLVLKGDMSLVGPRPERDEFVEGFIQEIPFYEKRVLVRPGITGWAQINHKYDETVDDVVEKLRYDLYYVRNVSFMLDMHILARTMWVMVAGKGAK